MKQVKKTCVILLVTLCIEVFYFNFGYFYAYLFSDVPHNIQLELGDFEIEHWQKAEDGLVSEFDPILVHDGINIFIEKILIQADLDQEIPYIVFFYTDDFHVAFSEETMIEVSQLINGAVEIPVSQYVKDIRIDLGDSAGIKLTKLAVTINPLHFVFSFVRYIAMLVVCFGFWALTSLQRSPEYGLDAKKAGSGEERETNV